MKKVNKMVKNSIKITKTQAEILYCLSNFLTITDIAKHRKTTKAAVCRVILRLIKKNLVQKIGITYRLTDQGKKGLTTLMGLSNKLRQHNFAIKIQILENPKNWDKKRNLIMQMPYFNKRINLKNNYYDLLSFGKVKIKTTSKSIIIHIPTIFADSVDNAVIQTMDILFDVIPKLENRFKIKLIKAAKLNMTIISQEYARLNDSLARLYRAEGNKLYFTGTDGKIWLIADYSLNIDELETIHPNKAGEDMTTVHKFFNDLRKNPATVSEILEAVRGNTATQTKMIQTEKAIVETQTIFDKNMQSHIKAVQDLGSGVRKFNSKIDKLFELLEEKNRQKV